MSDFAATWQLTRGRFVDAVSGLTHEQLNWRMQPDALTMGEMAVHVAGVEILFISQLLDSPLDELGSRIKAAGTDGVVNDQPFPFQSPELTPQFVEQALAMAHSMVEPVITNPEAFRQKQIKSALGPMVDGSGAFARLAYHPGYHQGQAHLIKTAPGFPTANVMTHNR